MTMQLLTCDTWGNEKDGYEINDIRENGIFFIFKENSQVKNETILRALKRADYLKKSLRFSSFTVDGDDYGLFIDYKGMPIYQLRRIDDKKEFGKWFLYNGDFPFHARNAIVFHENKNGNLRKSRA